VERSEASIAKGALLVGIAVVLTLFGVLMVAAAWNEAVLPFFLLAAVAWIFALNFFVAWVRLRQRDGDT
jgi:hypothetical protein